MHPGLLRVHVLPLQTEQVLPVDPAGVKLLLGGAYLLRHGVLRIEFHFQASSAVSTYLQYCVWQQCCPCKMSSTLDNEGPLTSCVIMEHLTLIQHSPAIPDPGPDIPPPVYGGVCAHMAPIVSEGLLLIILRMLSVSVCHHIILTHPGGPSHVPHSDHQAPPHHPGLWLTVTQLVKHRPGQYTVRCEIDTETGAG